jgi:CO/xanthine dehydrogenase FAD-binding subunit
MAVAAPLPRRSPHAPARVTAAQEAPVKPPPFRYSSPTTVADAVALLVEHADDDPRVLAGGQSLVPLLNFRIAAPECLVDINGLAELSFIDDRDGVLRVGAMTRQSDFERSELVSGGWPLLLEAARHIAHRQIRNRGTVGGSVAHADPAAELPAVFTALDARYRARSARGERVIESADMYLGPLMTALEPDELLTEIELMPLPARSGSAFDEFAMRHGDFALAGAAAVVTLDPEGACSAAALVLLGAASAPYRSADAEAVLVGRRVDAEAIAEAAELATRDIDPLGDIHGSSQYRRRIMRTIAGRVIETAARRAEEAR